MGRCQGEIDCQSELGNLTASPGHLITPAWPDSDYCFNYFLSHKFSLLSIGTFPLWVHISNFLDESIEGEERFVI